MLSVRGIVRKWVGESRTLEPVTLNDLLARTDGDVAASDGTIGVQFDDIHVPAAMLADLHDPYLVITLDYVGPTRGTSDRRRRGATAGGSGCRRAGRTDGVARRHRPPTTLPLRVRPLLVAVGLTAATVAPLTLAVAHWMAH